MEITENIMVSRFVRFIGPAALAFTLLASVGCAGSKSSKSSGSDYSSMDEGGAAPNTARLDEARRAAEDAETKAHQLREERARSQAKTSSN